MHTFFSLDSCNHGPCGVVKWDKDHQFMRFHVVIKLAGWNWNESIVMVKSIGFKWAQPNSIYFPTEWSISFRMALKLWNAMNSHFMIKQKISKSNSNVHPQNSRHGIRTAHKLWRYLYCITRNLPLRFIDCIVGCEYVGSLAHWRMRCHEMGWMPNKSKYIEQKAFELKSASSEDKHT